MLDRLRTWARNGNVPVALEDDLKDAADEIERLRTENTALRLELNIAHNERIDNLVK